MRGDRKSGSKMRFSLERRVRRRRGRRFWNAAFIGGDGLIGASRFHRNAPDALFDVADSFVELGRASTAFARGVGSDTIPWANILVNLLI